MCRPVHGPGLHVEFVTSIVGAYAFDEHAASVRRSRVATGFMEPPSARNGRAEPTDNVNERRRRC